MRTWPRDGLEAMVAPQVFLRARGREQAGGAYDFLVPGRHMLVSVGAAPYNVDVRPIA